MDIKNYLYLLLAVICIHQSLPLNLACNQRKLDYKLLSETVRGPMYSQRINIVSYNAIQNVLMLLTTRCRHFAFL